MRSAARPQLDDIVLRAADDVRAAAADARDHGADDRLGMAHEPVRQRRREAAADRQLQLVPLLPADFPQPLRRKELEQDRLPHDPRRRFAADQCNVRGRFSQEDEERPGALARDRARAGLQGPGFRHSAAAARRARPRSSSPNTSCRGSSLRPTTCRAIPRATSGTAPTAAPMSAGSIRRPAWSRNSTFRRSPTGALPGTHWIHVDKNDIVWGSENWAHTIWRLDPKTGEFKVHPMEGEGERRIRRWAAITRSIPGLHLEGARQEGQQGRCQ